MRGFIASFYKDLRLMLDKTGLLTIVLALLTVPVFLYGMRGFSPESVARPFPIAVRDRDNTFMSRSLLSQIAEIELFSEVNRLEEGVSDKEALARGNAAIVTIPKDFFYVMYYGGDCPVGIVFNESQPLQASVARALFTSVLDIIAADQSAFRAAYRFAYGDAFDTRKEQMYEEASKVVFLDALGRQSIFEEAIDLSDTPGVLRRKLTAMLLPMLSLLFAASALTSLARERQAGITARLAAQGAREGAFVFSKFAVTLLFLVPMCVLLYVLSGTGKPLPFALLAGLTVLASFAVMSGVVSFLRDESDARRLCNLYLLLSLFFGGTLLQTHPALRRLFLSGNVYPVLHALHAGADGRTVRRLLLPFVLIFLTALCASAAGGWFTKRAHGFPGTSAKREDGPLGKSVRQETNAVSRAGDGRTRGLFARLCAVVRFKTLLYAGGAIPLCVICLCAALTGYRLSGGTGGVVSSLTVAVADEDESALSGELVRLIRERAGDAVTIVPCTGQEGETMLVNGDAEGLLRIGAGYADAVSDNGTVRLHYRGTASAFSAQGVREIIAGRVFVQQAAYRAEQEAASLTGRALSDDEKEHVHRLVEEEAQSLPPLYRISGSAGTKAADPFTPDEVSFLALFLLLAVFTFASFAGRRDATAVTRRLAVSFEGRVLTGVADFLALFAEDLLPAVCFLFATGGGDAGLLPGLVLFLCASCALAFCVTGASGKTGRVDALAPMLTLLICLLGGCFLDLSVLSPRIAGVMMLSPAGALLFASRGSGTALAVLAAQSVLFFAIGMRKCYNR